MKTPSGKIETIGALSTPVIFPDTSESGVYSYKSSSRAGTFAVSLLDEDESQIASRFPAGLRRTHNLSGHGGRRSGICPLWPILLALVLMLLGLELFLAFKGGLALTPVLVRSAAVAAIALALINPKIFQPTRALDVILNVDLSRSVGREAREKTLEILATAAAVETRGHSHRRARLCTFTGVGVSSPSGRSVVRSRSISDREQTDIQTALQAAAAQTAEGRQEKVLLISDGNENRGETARVIPLLRTRFSAGLDTPGDSLPRS